MEECSGLHVINEVERLKGFHTFKKLSDVMDCIYVGYLTLLKNNDEIFLKYGLVYSCCSAEQSPLIIYLMEASHLPILKNIETWLLVWLYIINYSCEI